MMPMQVLPPALVPAVSQAPAPRTLAAPKTLPKPAGKLPARHFIIVLHGLISLCRAIEEAIVIILSTHSLQVLRADAAFAGAPVIVSPAPRPGPTAPVTKSCTLYVGKIASTVDNKVIKALLDACGTVKSWKRVEDTETGKPKPFGFCEYEDAEGVLMALGNLNELALDGQELLLKPNTSTQTYIEEYKAKKAREAAAAQEKKAQDGESAGDGTDAKDSAEAAGPSGKDENEVLEKIMAIVSEHSARSTAQRGGGSGAAAAADKFLNGLRSESGGGGGGLPGRSSRQRLPGPPERDERRIEDALAREKAREREQEARKRQELDRAYHDTETSWMRHERCAAAHAWMYGP